MSSTQTTTLSDDLASYLIQLADKLQIRIDDGSSNMNKKLDEMSKRIDTLERSLKQAEQEQLSPPVHDDLK